MSRLDRAIDLYLFAGDHFCQGLGDDVRPLDVQAYGILWLLGHGRRAQAEAVEQATDAAMFIDGRATSEGRRSAATARSPTARTCCGWRGR